MPSRFLTTVSFLYIAILGSFLVPAAALGQGQSLKDPRGHSYLRDMFYQYEAPLSQCDRSCKDSEGSSILQNRSEYKVGLNASDFVRIRLRYLERVSGLSTQAAQNVKLSSCLATFRKVENEFQQHIGTRSVTLYRLFQESDVQADFPKKCGKFLNDLHCPSEAREASPKSLQAFRGFSCVWRQVIHAGRALVECGKQNPNQRGPATVGEIVEQSELQNSGCASYIRSLDQSIIAKRLPGNAPVALSSHLSRSALAERVGDPSKLSVVSKIHFNRLPHRQPARQAPDYSGASNVQQ